MTKLGMEAEVGQGPWVFLYHESITSCRRGEKQALPLSSGRSLVIAASQEAQPVSSSCQGDLKIASAAREGGQGESEEKWPFAGKLPAMNPAWLHLEWEGLLCFLCFFLSQGQRLCLGSAVEEPGCLWRRPSLLLGPAARRTWQSPRKKKPSVLGFCFFRGGRAVQIRPGGHGGPIGKGPCTGGEHGTLLGAGSAISSPTFCTRISHVWCLHSFVGVLYGVIPARHPGHPDLGHFSHSVRRFGAKWPNKLTSWF